MLIIILFLVSLGHFTTDLYLPSLPAIAKFFAVANSIVKLTIPCYLIGMSFSPLLFGPLSDFIGRKRVIIFGLALGIIATLCCSLAINIYFLIIGRTLQGIAVGAILVAARAMVPDLYAGKELARRITQITMLMPLILAIAPLVGGYIQETWQWQAIFWLLIIYFTALLVIIPKIPETAKTIKNFSWRHPKVIIASYKKLLTNAPFITYGICSAIPTSGIFAYLTVSPFLFQNILGLSPVAYGKLSLYIGVGIIISGYFNTLLIKKWTLDTLLFIGAGIIISAGILLGYITYLKISSIAIIMLPILLFFFCNTLGIGNATAKSLTYLDGSFGTARALLATCQFLAGSFGSFIFSMITVKDGLYLATYFIFTGFIMIICTLIAQKAAKQLQEPPSEELPIEQQTINITTIPPEVCST